MSQDPRIVATPTGPVWQIPAGPAALDAAALGRAADVLPPSAVARRLRSMREGLLRVEELHARGEGCAGSASGTGGAAPVFEWATTADAAALTGVTARAITKACRLGRIPGAHHVAGHGWFIPTSVLPQLEDVDDGNEQAGAA
jgi:hypothetical protein